MYLRELFVKNSGPIRDLHLELTFSESDNPVPQVLVGRNGVGKTYLLSIIAEALMQGGTQAYEDVLTRKGFGTSYFRILGGKSLTFGESAGFAVLRFDQENGNLFYHEKTGELSVEAAKELLPETLKAGASWTEEQSKKFDIDQQKAREIYGPGAYVYFPASRSEHPFWFNEESIATDSFNTADRFASRLGKPMFVEHGTDAFAQWLLGVMTESRLQVTSAQFADGDQNRVQVELDTTQYLATQAPLFVANQLIQAIMDKPDAEFYWAGRHNARKIGVAAAGEQLATGLDALSGGQATLLAIFGTILRYADATGCGPQQVEGIVIVDELDAHVHINLQMNALPKLIAFFPKIQFIISSHSPFFALGMEKQFPGDAVRIIDLPTGLTVNAEAYNEFGTALTVLIETQAFEEKVGEFLAAAEQPVVWVAGETDVPYFQTAAKLLGYPQLIDFFQWIGTPGQSGGGEFTGDGNLKAAIKFLRANPEFTNRIIVAIFDNDAQQSDDQFDNVHVIGLKTVEGATLNCGIENLLPAHVFTPDVFQDKEKPSGIAGKPKILPELRKTLLCERLCGDDADVANFQAFEPYLSHINEIVASGTPTSSEGGDPSEDTQD